MTCQVDEDSETVDWEGLSEQAASRLAELEFGMLQRYPAMCLNMLLMQCQQIVGGQRPNHQGLGSGLSTPIFKVKKSNPMAVYQIEKALNGRIAASLFVVNHVQT